MIQLEKEGGEDPTVNQSTFSYYVLPRYLANKILRRLKCDTYQEVFLWRRECFFLLKQQMLVDQKLACNTTKTKLHHALLRWKQPNK